MTYSPATLPTGANFSPSSLLGDTLLVAVPLNMMELERLYLYGDKEGFLSLWSEWTNPEIVQELGTFSEAILFRSGTEPGDTARAFNALAKAIAAMSYLPGGVRVFGEHWTSEPDISKIRGEVTGIAPELEQEGEEGNELAGDYE
jgi:hypothetical protein